MVQPYEACGRELISPGHRFGERGELLSSGAAILQSLLFSRQAEFNYLVAIEVSQIYLHSLNCACGLQISNIR